MQRPQFLYKFYLALVRTHRFVFPPKAFSPSWLQVLLANRYVLPLVVQARRLFFALIGSKMRTLTARESLDSHLCETVIPHQIWQASRVARARTERVLRLLPSIGGLQRDTAQVLCIGPRNETELFLLRSIGFRAKNISAIDLFTYTPKIQVMDMHHLTFAEDSFDLIYCAFTLRYSSDPDRAVEEMIRCARHGALVLIIFIKPANVRMRPGGVSSYAKFENGLADVYRLFGDTKGPVLWQEEWVRVTPENEAEAIVCSTIFRIDKQTEGRCV